MNAEIPTPEQIAADARQVVLADVYTGLRMGGYTFISALKALRILGLSLAEAKAVADACDAQRMAMQQLAMLEHFESAVAH
jgi:ribosomal protein L7/L12